MDVFEIEGGHDLSGTVRISGNKNAALPMLAASVLATETVVLRDVPDIGDVRTMLGLLDGLGITSSRDAHGVLTLDPTNVASRPLDRDLATRIRASLLLAGPLLARFGDATMPSPGGDTIGRRRNDTHWHAFTSLGAEFTESESGYRLRAPNGLHGVEILLDEASVMATENAVMAAVIAKGQTVIRNAASEPHVQDLCNLLNAMGAQIGGISSNVLTIDGVDQLGGADATVGPDFMEIGSFIGLGAVTPGELRLGPVRMPDLPMILGKFDLLGVHVYEDNGELVVPNGQVLAVRNDHGGHIPRIHESPWPMFPADLMSIALVVATQAVGTVLLHQWMFESRLFFTDRLIEMGARIIIADPHRAVISGPAKLRGATVSSPDIRAGMALLIAALCAEGPSTIGNIRQIDRGYERIDDKLRALGAKIQRIPG